MTDREKLCCEPMEHYVQYSNLEKGLVLMTLIRWEAGLPVHRKRLAYRKGKSFKSESIYINFCPWCGSKHNKDLQDD